MSDDLFEVAFSGEIRAGENLDDVKSRVGKMFNADEGKVAQLFSGNRIVIKKNIDQQTAAKYKVALNKAGAECEINAMSPSAPTPTPPPVEASVPAAPPPPPSTQVDYGDVEPPPQTDPLGITAGQIEELSASLAPVGSELQDEIKQIEEPDIDITGFEVAPVGSTIGVGKKEPDPPPPDTTGLSLAD